MLGLHKITVQLLQCYWIGWRDERLSLSKCSNIKAAGNKNANTLPANTRCNTYVNIWCKHRCYVAIINLPCYIVSDWFDCAPGLLSLSLPRCECSTNPHCTTGVLSTGSCYWEVTTERTWDEADADCRSKGGILAVMSTPAQYNAINAALTLTWVQLFTHMVQVFNQGGNTLSDPHSNPHITISLELY